MGPVKREVLRFPDPRLRKKALSVSAVTPELQGLADDMLETMYAENGIGLAAPQVGESVRLLVIDTRPTDEDGHPTDEGMTDLERQVKQPIVIFNPEIIVAQEKTKYDEGCLSVPGYFESVERSRYIEAKGLDRDGRELVIRTDGLLAICLQHEMDHLEGKLFIDRLSFVKSERIKSKIKKTGYPSPQEVDEERAKVREARAQAKAKSNES
jgi:peptide deformylase